MEGLKSLRPYILMFGAVFYNCVLATMLVGWPSLRTVMIDEKVYHNLCPKNSTVTMMDLEMSFSGIEPVMFTPVTSEDEPCVQQTLRLDLMFVIASSLLNIAGTLVGKFSEATIYLQCI